MKNNGLDENFCERIRMHYGLKVKETYELRGSKLSVCALDGSRGRGSIKLFTSRERLLIMTDLSFSSDETVPRISGCSLWIGYFENIGAEIHSGKKTVRMDANTVYAGSGYGEDWNVILRAGQQIRGILIIYGSAANPSGGYTAVPQAEHDASRPVSELAGDLNEIKNVPELSAILYQLENCGTNGLSKIYYFKAKLHETTSVLLDLSEQKELVKNNQRKVSEEDRASIVRLTEYIGEDLARHTGLSELAQMVCMSPAKLKYTFKAVTGRSVTDYRQDRRMERAQYLLTCTNVQLGNIAHELGFSSASHFSSSFRTKVGMTPSEYRQAYSHNDFSYQ